MESAEAVADNGCATCVSGAICAGAVDDTGIAGPGGGKVFCVDAGLDVATRLAAVGTVVKEGADAAVGAGALAIVALETEVPTAMPGGPAAADPFEPDVDDDVVAAEVSLALATAAKLIPGAILLGAGTGAGAGACVAVGTTAATADTAADVVVAGVEDGTVDVETTS